LRLRRLRVAEKGLVTNLTAFLTVPTKAFILLFQKIIDAQSSPLKPYRRRPFLIL
jgi:hypothetical protein